MNGISSDLSTAGSSYSIDTSLEPMGFYLTKTDLSRLNTIANLTGCSKLLFMYGVDDDGTGNQSFTVVLMGADSSGIFCLHTRPTVQR